MSPPAYAFGRRLRDQRERRGITLETIAATTKINASLLAALERGDVSAWPGGIFRRAFVREYAAAIGASSEPILEEFARLFPDSFIADANDAQPQASDLRMTLAVERRWVASPALKRAIVGLLEAGLIAGMAWAAAWIGRADAWTLCATIATIYYPLATVCLGRSPALWCFERGFHVHRKPVRPLPVAETRELLYLVARSSPETVRNREPDIAVDGVFDLASNARS